MKIPSIIADNMKTKYKYLRKFFLCLPIKVINWICVFA